MKVKELIAELQKRDAEQEVRVAVRTATTAYPSAYVTPWEVCQANDSVRLEITLPDGMYIGKRKAA